MMHTLLRYLRLFRVQVRSSVLLGMQYRADFLIDGAVSFFWTTTALVPLFVVFHDRPAVAGWSFAEALVVVGWFTLLEAILEGAISPSLTAVVEHIRKGTLDFVLLKPADAQFLVSTARFEPWRSTNLLTALAIWGVAFVRMGKWPSLLGLCAAVVLLASATLLLYSLWILTVSAAFYVVKVDNLTNLFNSVFDAARWPVQVFRGVLRWIFTLVVPLALMTTYPAEAMLGRLSPLALTGSVVGACAFAWVSRRVWLGSLARYASASS
ncbi:MAG TPA: ABC-2 family transporter protein [Myxococcaceae bacterium]|jgi:ABC-2 type transport system permease protein|nr:ABC-2 family transporter protein [Myxococcaceae bacterium]